MPDPDRALIRHRLAFRAVLAVLGAIQAINGLWAVLAPRSFTEGSLCAPPEARRDVLATRP